MKRDTPKYSGNSSGPKAMSITVQGLSGGLNLGKDPLQLATEQSPDCMNVDFPPLGGVTRRKAIMDLSARVEGDFAGLVQFERGTQGAQILYGIKSGANISLFESTSTVPKDIFQADRIAGITMDNKCYLALGHLADARRWDGVQTAALNGNFADNPEALPHGSMPRAKVLAVYKGSVFAFNLADDPCGMRWSWPNEPEDWPSWAHESIASGEKHDEIVAAVAQQERLLIFKRNSVHAVTGDGPRDFRLVTLSHEIGAAGFDAVSGTDHGVFFYDHPNGLFKVDASGGPQPTSWERIRPGIAANSAGNSAALVGWADKRLYVSLASTSAVNDRTYIMEPITGNWTAHDYGLTGLVQVIPPDAADFAVATAKVPGATGFRLSVLNQDGNNDYGSLPITARWQSAWFSDADLMLPKRWRKARFIVQGPARLRVDARIDYRYVNGSTFYIEAPSSTAPKWGSSTWGSFVWGDDTTDEDIRLEKGRSAGTGRALSLVVSNDSPGDWRLSALQIDFIPKRRRN